MESYYDTLGVSPTADAAQLRRAYRQAVRRTHPDTGGSPTAFHAVQTAWNTLSDPARRSRYDARNHPTEPSPSSPPRQEPPAPEPDAAPEPPRPPPEPSQETRPPPQGQPFAGWIPVTLTAVFLATGGLTWLILADLGRPFAVFAGIYLASTALLVAAARTGAVAGQRALTMLLHGAWILGVGFIALGMISWADNRSPWAGLAWGACVLAFAGSTTALRRSLAPPDRSPHRMNT